MNSAYTGGSPAPPARRTTTTSQTRAPRTSTGTAPILIALAVPSPIQPLRVAPSRSWVVLGGGRTRTTVGRPHCRPDRSSPAVLNVQRRRGLAARPLSWPRIMAVDARTTSAFDLPDQLARKADRALIAQDEVHFAAIAESLEQAMSELSDRLGAQRRSPGGAGQAAMDRDMEIHRLTARLRVLRRYGLDLCLGHMVRSGDPQPVYVGRLGLTDSAGRRLLIDWRSPAGEP